MQQEKFLSQQLIALYHLNTTSYETEFVILVVSVQFDRRRVEGEDCVGNRVSLATFPCQSSCVSSGVGHGAQGAGPGLHLCPRRILSSFFPASPSGHYSLLEASYVFCTIFQCGYGWP